MCSLSTIQVLGSEFELEKDDDTGLWVAFINSRRVTFASLQDAEYFLKEFVDVSG